MKIASLVLGALFAATGAQAQDLLITGGTIRTGVEAAPVAEAVLVRGGRIAYEREVGDGVAMEELQEFYLGGSEH